MPGRAPYIRMVKIARLSLLLALSTSALAACDRFCTLETQRTRDGEDWTIEWRVRTSGR